MRLAQELRIKTNLSQRQFRSQGNQVLDLISISKTNNSKSNFKDSWSLIIIKYSKFPQIDLRERLSYPSFLLKLYRSHKKCKDLESNRCIRHLLQSLFHMYQPHPVRQRALRRSHNSLEVIEWIISKIQLTQETQFTTKEALLLPHHHSYIEAQITSYHPQSQTKKTTNKALCDHNHPTKATHNRLFNQLLKHHHQARTQNEVINEKICLHLRKSKVVIHSQAMAQKWS